MEGCVVKCQNKMKKFSQKLLVICMISGIGIMVGLVPALAQETLVPDWVKNNALWWAEGKITEQEYLNAIQFLIEEEIITVSVFEETTEEALKDPRSIFFESAKPCSGASLIISSSNLMPPV